MAVRTDQGLARCAEALQMYLMADAVACLRIVDAVLLSDRTDIFVVVRILEAGLQGIVVNVSDRTLGLDLIDAHRLKLEISHRAGGILRQRLIDLKADLLTQCHFAVYQCAFKIFCAIVIPMCVSFAPLCPDAKVFRFRAPFSSEWVVAASTAFSTAQLAPCPKTK